MSPEPLSRSAYVEALRAAMVFVDRSVPRGGMSSEQRVRLTRLLADVAVDDRAPGSQEIARRLLGLGS